jgi:hypothetical protein
MVFEKYGLIEELTSVGIIKGRINKRDGRLPLANRFFN